MTNLTPLASPQIAETRDLGGKIGSIPLNHLYAWQQVALMRIMLYITGQVHELLGAFTKQARALAIAAGNAEGKLDTTGAYQAQVEIAKAWGDTLRELQTLILDGIHEGASLPFGVQAAYHEKLIVTPLASPQIAETRDLGGKITEAMTEGVFETQLQLLIDAALRISGPDGKQFSTRIWALDRESREGMNQVIMQAVTDKKSAWQLAKDLEQYLGAGQDCPRWTYARLNGVGSPEKAKGDLSGLLGGEDCAGQGVSYNALRLARTEIQRVHHLANDDRMRAMPWIEQEKIVLSDSHPKTDICDQVAHGGEKSDGVYPKGTIQLPLHPHCFCDKRAVQDLEKFGERLADWVKTGSGFPAMDQYAASLGADFKGSLLGDKVAQAFGVWCFDQYDKLAARLK
jgi:hypothetical protein